MKAEMFDESLLLVRGFGSDSYCVCGWETEKSATVVASDLEAVGKYFGFFWMRLLVLI